MSRTLVLSEEAYNRLSEDGEANAGDGGSLWITFQSYHRPRRKRLDDFNDQNLQMAPSFENDSGIYPEPLLLSYNVFGRGCRVVLDEYQDSNVELA